MIYRTFGLKYSQLLTLKAINHNFPVRLILHSNPLTKDRHVIIKIIMNLYRNVFHISKFTGQIACKLG